MDIQTLLIEFNKKILNSKFNLCLSLREGVVLVPQSELNWSCSFDSEETQTLVLMLSGIFQINRFNAHWPCLSSLGWGVV